MMTSSNGNIFRVTGLCEGNPPVTDQWRGALMFSFIILCLNKRSSKQSWRRWFETPLRSLWRHCNADWFSTIQVPVPHKYGTRVRSALCPQIILAHNSARSLAQSWRQSCICFFPCFMDVNNAVLALWKRWCNSKWSSCFFHGNSVVSGFH